MSIKLTAAEKISDIMHETGGTVTGDAKKMGVSQCTLSDFLNGKRRNINIDTLTKMCEFYNVSADYLLGFSETRTLNEGVKAICNSSQITEKAAETLCELTNPCSVAFIVGILESDRELLERVSKKFLAYDHAKNVVEPSVRKNHKQLGDKKIIVDYTINGEKAPSVPVQDLCDYTRFELLRAFIELADKSFTEAE